MAIRAIGKGSWDLENKGTRLKRWLKRKCGWDIMLSGSILDANNCQNQAK